MSGKPVAEIIALTIMFFIAGVLGVALGHGSGMEEVQIEAVDRGFGHWSAEKEFEWVKK